MLGSDQFVATLRGLAGPVTANPPVPEARQLAGFDAEAICRPVASYYGLELMELSRRRYHETACSIAAWLCRRYTEAPLRELAMLLGLSPADSVPNLTRQLTARPTDSAPVAAGIEAISQRINVGQLVAIADRRARKTKNQT